MADFVQNADLMRNVENSTAPLNDMLSKNDIQSAANKLRADLHTMDRDSFMLELGEVQRATANTPTHIVIRPITDEMGNLQGKDIALVTTGYDSQQKPVDCNIPIGQIRGEQTLPCPEPIVVQPNVAFELVCRPGNGWGRRPDGTFIYAGPFPAVAVGVPGMGVGIGVPGVGIDINLGGPGPDRHHPPHGWHW